MKTLKALLILMRPTQWIKNGFVVMPLVFSAKLMILDDVAKAAGMVVSFCLASSATYILNDLVDIERDKAHPLKRNRPLAHGDVSPAIAIVAMALLLAGTFGLGVAMGLPKVCHLYLAGYLVIQLAYSFVLKNVVILDVLTLSTGFMLRVMAGAAAIDVSVSSWLILCTFALAILLALGKRRHEIVILNNGASAHRPVLNDYSVFLLDQLLQLATGSTFIFYCLYSVRGNPAAGIEPERMMFTIPLVTYGVFRYMYLVYHKEQGGSPTALLLTDPPLLACTIVWLAACVVIVYL